MPGSWSALRDPFALGGGGAEAPARGRPVEVVVGVLAAEAARVHEAWLTSSAPGAPSSPGSTPPPSTAARGRRRTSRWITGRPPAPTCTGCAPSRRRHRRVGTVLADDPPLTVAPDPGTSPCGSCWTAGRTPPSPARVLDGCSPHPRHRADEPAAVARRPARRAVSSACSWRAGPRWRRRSCGPAWSTGSSATSHRPCSARAPARSATSVVGTIADALRLRLDEVTRVGDDLRLTLRSS